MRRHAYILLLIDQAERAAKYLDVSCSILCIYVFLTMLV